MKLEDIKQHWKQAGQDLKTGSKISPTSRDPFLGELERANILDYLDERLTCLEIGCGDGLHTIHYAQKTKKIFALDIAAELIDLANIRMAQESIENIEFRVGSILDLVDIFKGRQFDCIISQRCLINLPDWDHQREVLSQINSLLIEGGLLLLSEGFQDNLNNLNEARILFSLPEIKVVEYNRNIFSEEFNTIINQYFDVIDKRNYGLYLFLSRIYHPLVVLPEEPKHHSVMNEVAMKISSLLSINEMEKYSYNLFYALKKVTKAFT